VLACAPHLARLGMTVFARKLRDRGRVSVAITHSPDKLVVEERSSLARTTSTAYELDGQPHQATVHNKPAQVAAQWVGCKLIIDTSFCDGTATRTVATRMLADVDTQVHEVRVFKDDLLTCTCRRTLVRDLSKPQPKFVESLRFLHATAKGGMQAHVGGAPRSSFGPDSEAKGTTHQTQDSGGRRVAWTQTPASVQRAYVGLAWLVVGAAIALVASWLPQALLPAVGCFVVWEGWTRFVAQPSALPPTNEPSNGPSREGMEGTAAPSHSALQPGKKNK